MSNEAEVIAGAAESIPAAEVVTVDGFGAVEMDAIGEIQNITMGSAATAVSNLLGAKVWITTPTVKIVQVKNMLYPNLEPSVQVKIEYIKGVSGSSILVLKQSDVQLILNQLMGLPLVVTEDFKFDEMNISAVCEVMNQMMGSAATALSELIDTSIDISTPEASVTEEDGQNYFPSGKPDDYVVQISFNLTIDGIIKSEFISVLDLDLAKTMAEKMMNGYNTAIEEATPPKQPEPATSSGKTQEEIEREMAEAFGMSMDAPAASAGPFSPPPAPAASAGPFAPPPAPGPFAPPPAPAQSAGPFAPPPPPMQQQQQYAPPPQEQQMPPYGYPPQQPPPPYGYPPQQPYGYPQQPQMPPQQPLQQPMAYGYGQQVQKGGGVNIQPAQLHSFESYDTPRDLSRGQGDNLKLLMNVPLDVTVEIGSTKRKVKEILDFTQGTIIELERQAGAPVDVIVNGNLIARGDVVVIEDNFAVRITEIIKSRFLDTLGNKE